MALEKFYPLKHRFGSQSCEGNATGKAVTSVNISVGFAPVSHHSQNMGTNSWGVSKDISICGFKEGLYKFTRIGTG